MYYTGYGVWNKNIRHIIKNMYNVVQILINFEWKNIKML